MVQNALMLVVSVAAAAPGVEPVTNSNTPVERILQEHVFDSFRESKAKFDFGFRRAPMRDAVKAMANLSGLTFQVSSSALGPKISVKLEKVSALDCIRWTLEQLVANNDLEIRDGILYVTARPPAPSSKTECIGKRCE